jgi:hypothetical protein
MHLDLTIFIQITHPQSHNPCTNPCLAMNHHFHPGKNNTFSLLWSIQRVVVILFRCKDHDIHPTQFNPDTDTINPLSECLALAFPQFPHANRPKYVASIQRLSNFARSHQHGIDWEKVFISGEMLWEHCLFTFSWLIAGLIVRSIWCL